MEVVSRLHSEIPMLGSPGSVALDQPHRILNETLGGIDAHAASWINDFRQELVEQMRAMNRDRTCDSQKVGKSRFSIHARTVRFKLGNNYVIRVFRRAQTVIKKIWASNMG